MSDVNIPLVGGPKDRPQAIPVEFSQDEANYLLHVVDFYRTTIAELVSVISPSDLVFLLAFLQAAIETQHEAAAEAFDESRQFFDQIYPAILAQHNEQEGAVKAAADEMVIAIPRPSPEGVALNPMSDEPRIITPGSGLIQ